MKPSLVIVGSARDIGESDSTSAIMKLKAHFELVEVIIVESDSVDETLAHLHEWRDIVRDRTSAATAFIHLEDDVRMWPLALPTADEPLVPTRTACGHAC